MMALLGAHSISSNERSYQVHRMSGLITIFGTFAFALVILTTEGKVINTPAWQPFLDWTNGWVIIGGWLLVSGMLGFVGLAFEDEDKHWWPRAVTIISAFIGASWFTTAAVSFIFAWADRDWVNAGPFLAIPAAILHMNRIALLAERRKHGKV